IEVAEARCFSSKPSLPRIQPQPMRKVNTDWPDKLGTACWPKRHASLPTAERCGRQQNPCGARTYWASLPLCHLYQGWQTRYPVTTLCFAQFDYQRLAFQLHLRPMRPVSKWFRSKHHRKRFAADVVLVCFDGLLQVRRVGVERQHDAVFHLE